MDNCSNNSIYEEALKKIKRDQKCKPSCCALIGPTGPTGPKGETPTIAIGTVTSGEKASATITGISPNFTLNLVLPIYPTESSNNS